MMDHHPIADLFPMLPEDELKELAADIKQRGLLQPIVLDSDGRILDGRNRYAACNLAGVEPQFATYDGDDPDGYALATNVVRRELSAGQKAMLVGKAIQIVFGQGKTLAGKIGIPQPRMAEAKVILDFAPDAVDDVIAGVLAFSEALRIARKNKAEAETEEARIDALRALAPDLAVLVENNVRDLPSALAEAENRKIVRDIDEVRNAEGAPAPSFADRAGDGAISWEEAATLAELWRTERDESIRRDQDRLRNVISCWGALRTIKQEPTNPYATAVIGGLGDNDRDQLDRILSEVAK